MSDLNYGAIDTTFPVAGQDNNSQGFRGNFSAIAASLATAESAITTLETTTAKLNDDNNFLGTVISNATTKQVWGETYPLNNITTPQFVDVSNASFQYITFAANTTVTFQNWPATGKYACIRLHLIGDGNAERTATLGTEAGGDFVAGAGITLNISGAPQFTLAANGKHRVVEAWTYNGGVTVYVKDLGEF